MSKQANKVLSLLVAVAMIFTMMPLTGFAAEGEIPLGDSDSPATPTDITVAAFDALPIETRFQTYGAGELASGDDLLLPDTLTGTDADDTPLSIEGVTWQSEPAFDPAVEVAYPGYIFTPTLPDGYALAEDVTAPVITVFIRPAGGVEIQPLAAPSAVQNLTATPYNGRVVLTWDAPASDGGSPITQYRAGWSLSGADYWQGITDMSDSTFTHTSTGLTNGTAYDFRVIALESVDIK